MSFMAGGGADCSASRNPLTQFSKHANQDTSLQRPEFISPAEQSQRSIRSVNPGMAAADQEALRHFSQGHPAGNFHFEAMRHELARVDAHSAPQNAPNGWASEFSTAAPQSAASNSSLSLADKQWTSEFRSRDGSPMTAAGAPPNVAAAPYMPRFAPQLPMGGMYGAGPMAGPMAGPTMAPATGRIVELSEKNWEEEFHKVESSLEEKGKLRDDGGTATETAEPVATVLTDAEAEAEVLDESAAKHAFEQDEFERIWNNINSKEEYNDSFWNQDPIPDWERDYVEHSQNRANYGDYRFEESNQFLDMPDAFAIGVQLQESGAKLSEAALAFEAAVQQDPNHVEAWLRLGNVQTQNEKEDAGIRALEKTLQLDPENLAALMNLAVSYLNEGYDNASYATLEKWISVKYPEIAAQARKEEPQLTGENRFLLHKRVTELFMKAAQLSPTGANMDADVQLGLGVLFYGNEEYDKTIDCFRTALAIRPDDALLWNRLGASLANSQRSEEALEAYYKALELRPSFVRARYNLAVSCINIGCYKEAAEHLLGALSMHKVEGARDDKIATNQSTALYETLKRTFLAMNRRDLIEAVGSGMNVDDFRGEFNF